MLYDFVRRNDDEMRTTADRLLQQMSQRRSCRWFSDERVPRSLIEKVIAIGHSAPSGANRKPWRFVAVDDPALKRRIRVAAEKEERENYGRRFPKAWLDALEPIGTDANKPFLEEAPWLVVLFRIDSIVFGILLYLLRSHIYRIPIPVIVLAIAGTVVYLFSGYHRIHNGQSNPFEFRFLIFAAITLFSCAVLSLFLRLEDFFKKRLKKVSLWGGRISYGVYLFHIPVGALVGRFLDMTGIFFLLLSILTICGATTAIYHFFERPILNARPDFDFDEEPGPRPK